MAWNSVDYLTKLNFFCNVEGLKLFLWKIIRFCESRIIFLNFQTKKYNIWYDIKKVGWINGWEKNWMKRKSYGKWSNSLNGIWKFKTNLKMEKYALKFSNISTFFSSNDFNENYVQFATVETLLCAWFGHQLFNFVRKVSLNKLIRAFESPFAFRRTRYSYKSEKYNQ